MKHNQLFRVWHTDQPAIGSLDNQGVTNDVVAVGVQDYLQNQNGR